MFRIYVEVRTNSPLGAAISQIVIDYKELPDAEDAYKVLTSIARDSTVCRTVVKLY